jgi:hypothetical protein
MTNESATSGRPPAVDRATFQAELDQLRAREKAHTREGDAIAAARRPTTFEACLAQHRRLPMSPCWPRPRSNARRPMTRCANGHVHFSAHR